MSAPEELKAKLQLCVDDPMWADHVEMPKRLLREMIAALSIPAQRTASDETAWLIERGDLKPEMIHYFRFDMFTAKGITIKHWSWTSDNQQATRFGRKIDAELAWQCATQRMLDEVDVVEHMWCAPSPALLPQQSNLASSRRTDQTIRSDDSTTALTGAREETPVAFPPSGAPGVPSDETIGVAVDVVLREGVWPENIREDDRGLERDEYIEFVAQVLTILAASPPPVPPQERPYPIEKFKTLTDRARNSIEGQNWATENMGVAEYAAIDMAVMFVVAELTGRSLADWLTSQPGQSQEESGPR